MNKKITTRTKILILLFILGLHLSAYHLMNSTSFEEPVSTQSSDFSSTTQEGTYKLLAGTDGCPLEVDWTSNKTTLCRGFTLNLVQVDSTFRAEQFCHLNGGQKTSHRKLEAGNEKTKVSVTRSENIIQKRSFTTIITASGSDTIPQEDTLIFDEPGKFLWEHSRRGRGHSCLYSRHSI